MLVYPGDFVLIEMKWWAVDEAVDSSGYFIASDDDGEERQFHVEQVDLVDSKMKTEVD